MRPYPGKSLTKAQTIFNYRLSRARRVIENIFGILASRWRIFQGPITAKVENIEKYTQAAICLHNYVLMWEERTKRTKKYYLENYVDTERNGIIELGEWREYVYDSQVLQPSNRLGSNNAKRSYFELRGQLSQYFLSKEGQVPW